MKHILDIVLLAILLAACTAKEEPNELSSFPYSVTEETQHRKMSVAMKRSFENYSAMNCIHNLNIPV